MRRPATRWSTPTPGPRGPRRRHSAPGIAPPPLGPGDRAAATGPGNHTAAEHRIAPPSMGPDHAAKGPGIAPRRPAGPRAARIGSQSWPAGSYGQLAGNSDRARTRAEPPETRPWSSGVPLEPENRAYPGTIPRQAAQRKVRQRRERSVAAAVSSWLGQPWRWAARPKPLAGRPKETRPGGGWRQTKPAGAAGAPAGHRGPARIRRQTNFGQESRARCLPPSGGETERSWHCLSG
jgi:hypothetical protein